MVIPVAWIREKWYSISEGSPQGEWDKIAELMMFLKSAKAHTQSFDERIHDREECSKAKVVGNCRHTSAPTLKRLKLCFAQLLM